VKVLIVEDEPLLREGLEDLLRGAGHSVEAVADGLSGLSRGTDPSFDLILLDLMLPRLDGMSVCRQIRELRPLVPILMLTARGSEQEKVKGFQAGADDYLTKPFGTQELLARITALGRRASAASATELLPIEAGDLTIDISRCQARRKNGETISLTSREAEILRWLYQHRSRAVSRTELLEVIWNSSGDLQTRTVDMTIANLRQKIETSPPNPQIVITIKGVGYAWGNP
jgi:DNA-binding response OmpR family regulator